MGPYDNETGEHIYFEDVMNSFWFISQSTGALYIVPRDEDSFEGYGPDEALVGFSDEMLSDDNAMMSAGFDPVPDVLRRFEPEIGYFST